MNMKKKSLKKTISLTILFNNGSEVSIRSIKLRRIFSFIQRAEKFEVKLFKLRVTYFPIDDFSSNKGGIPLNEGEYKDIKNLKLALKAFLEV